MKNVIFFFLFFCLIISFSACGPTPAPEVTKADYNSLSEQVTGLTTLLNDVQQYLETDPSYHLYLMDQDLDAVERGDEPKGSFSDYFVPNASKALKVGASKKALINVLNV